MLKPIPQTLKEAFAKKNLVPLIGAGVSMSVRTRSFKQLLPSWTELLRLGIDELDRQAKPSHAQIARGQIDLRMYQDAADTIKNGLKGALWDDFLRKTFSCEIADIDEQTLRLPRAIWALSDRLMSLNYDNICEFAYNGETEIISFDSTQSSELASFARHGFENPSIWHIHGRINNISSVVLTGASYESFYGQNGDFKAALSVLSETFQNSTVIFVGCSLEDAELLSRINNVHALFDGNTPPHFALVHQEKASSIRAKLVGMPIEVIEFEDFGEPILAILESIRSQPSGSVSVARPSPTLRQNEGVSVVAERSIRAAILFSNPIDRKRDQDRDVTLSEIAKLKIEKHYYHLTLTNLQNLENFDYVFIVTTILKGRLLIEDEYMSSERISLGTLIENVGQLNVSGIFVFSDHGDIEDEQLANDVLESHFPLAVFPKLEKAEFGSLFFKAFRRKKIETSRNALFSGRPFEFKDLCGRSDSTYYRTVLPDGIDARSVKNFTGRMTDLKNISRALIDLVGTDEILTVKAAGGMGKTAVAQIIAIAASNRNLYGDGIEFIDCEFVASYEVFERMVARFFNLEFELDLKNELRNINDTNRLLILDNVETLIYLTDSREIRNLISFISDYSTILVTSREPLNLENEKVYELRRLTSDEASELFKKQLGPRTFTDEEEKLIRHSIVEELLDNNPLAINLITRTIPSGKDLGTLVQELRNDFFSKIADSDMSAFDSKSDVNVERKRSLYASINYSYTRLNEKEGRAFELLSLFPDGVNMELFKRIAHDVRLHRRRDNKELNNPTNQFMVSDQLLRSLEAKSMIQSNNGIVRLQSLVGKFAEHKLRQRDSAELTRIYANFFDHVSEFASFLRRLHRTNPVLQAKVFNGYQKNFLRAVSISSLVPASPEEICRYLIDILPLCVATSVPGLLINALSEANLDFAGHETEELSLRVLEQSARYYDGDFDGALLKMRSILPREKLLAFPNTSFLERDLALSTSWIYGMEGEILDAVILTDRHDAACDSYPDTLLQLGYIYHDVATVSDEEFFTFEARFILGTLTVEAIDRYIDNLPERRYLEIVQANYVRVKLVGTPRTPVSAMVPVNPYSIGIKYLILAIGDTQVAEQRRYFELAIANLYHIKYYYVEAILFFTKFLLRHDHVEYEEYLAKGMTLAKEYHFRYLIYLYEQLANPNGVEYSDGFSPLPMDRDYNASIQSLRNRALNRR